MATKKAKLTDDNIGREGATDIMWRAEVEALINRLIEEAKDPAVDIDSVAFAMKYAKITALQGLLKQMDARKSLRERKRVIRAARNLWEIGSDDELDIDLDAVVVVSEEADKELKLKRSYFVQAWVYVRGEDL